MCCLSKVHQHHDVRGDIPGTSTTDPDANNDGAESDSDENSTKDSDVETAMVTCDEAAAA